MTEDLAPHSPAWYDRLARMQSGYYFPWRSQLAPDNGEDRYTSMVTAHLTPELDVVDCGCGHGEDALSIAPHVRSVVGYDRTQPFIELAERARRERDIDNVRFVLADSRAAANDGRARMPLEDHSVDLFVSRRGPRNWIADVPRVARPGAILVQLNPLGGDLPSWNQELPEPLRMRTSDLVSGPDEEQRILTRRLNEAGLDLYGFWTFDVPEHLATAEDLYTRLVWSRDPNLVPGYGEVRTQIEELFEQYATLSGLELRYRTMLWKAIV